MYSMQVLPIYLNVMDVANQVLMPFTVYPILYYFICLIRISVDVWSYAFSSSWFKSLCFYKFLTYAYDICYIKFNSPVWERKILVSIPEFWICYNVPDCYMFWFQYLHLVFPLPCILTFRWFYQTHNYIFV